MPKEPDDLRLRTDARLREWAKTLPMGETCVVDAGNIGVAVIRRVGLVGSAEVATILEWVTKLDYNWLVHQEINKLQKRRQATG